MTITLTEALQRAGKLREAITDLYECDNWFIYAEQPGILGFNSVIAQCIIDGQTIATVDLMPNQEPLRIKEFSAASEVRDRLDQFLLTPALRDSEELRQRTVDNMLAEFYIFPKNES